MTQVAIEGHIYSQSDSYYTGGRAWTFSVYELPGWVQVCPHTIAIEVTDETEIAQKEVQLLQAAQEKVREQAQEVIHGYQVRINNLLALSYQS